ncbi:unnamed protein product [Cladocopium goreaui]|uniref:PABS domain-containing protein n=1 Tax=Cladocopium goreaui TaxID=2562237 RepID=A0A9P1C5U4_9DINO|nr:unnamed protein product [Cladocopium goreaui]
MDASPWHPVAWGPQGPSLGPSFGLRCGTQTTAPCCAVRSGFRTRRARTDGWQVAALITAAFSTKGRTYQRCVRRSTELDLLDQQDPGRSALRGEWAVPGTVIFAADTAESGAVRVTGSGASSGGHWRRLRFNESTEQSVLLLDANLHPRHEALAFGYLKSLAAVGSATLRCLGTATPWRVLVLGVGLGALPGWFASKAKALVHAIDLDPLVLKAAETVGLMPPALHGTERCLEDGAQDGPALRTYCCDGVEYVAACAKSTSGLPLYDLIVMDVFDGEGETPEAFLTEDFGRSCAAIASSCVVNLTCPVPMWEDAHAFNAPSAGRLAEAFRSGFQSQAWSVRVAEGQNLIMAATRMGAPPEKYLKEASLELAKEEIFAFDPVRRVSFRRQDWCLQTSILMDAPVLDLVEEADRSTLQARKVRRREGISVTSKLDELEGEPAAFRSSRSFAMMLPNCVQVIRLNFKSVATQRAPLSATECCTQLAQLSQVNGSTPVQARWSFDDVGVPSFEEQRRHLATASSPPPVRLGRWLQGLLRFLAVALRPVWDLPLVVTVSHRETLGLVQQSLGLGIAEDAVRRLIGRLRPAVRFAHGAESGQKSKAVDPASSSAARFKLYTSERSVQSEAVAQARQTLHGVLEVADRALEVLSLLSLLQEQKSAYRVLRSNLLSSDLLQRLQCTSFGQLVESDDALDPAVQLCSAFLVESRWESDESHEIGLIFSSIKGGLTTPMADAQATPGAKFQRFGSAGGLCRDLEEQCPQIFKKLDLSFVNSRFGDMAPARPLTAAAFGKAAVENQESCLELLHRYAQCVSVNSPEDHWVSLSQTLRAAVSEDPKRAAEAWRWKSPCFAHNQTGIWNSTGAQWLEGPDWPPLEDRSPILPDYVRRPAQSDPA